MASRRQARNDDRYAGPSGSKRRKEDHRLSESDEDGSDDDHSSMGQFGDPQAFLRKYGGYQTDRESDDDGSDHQDSDEEEEKEEGEFSSSEDEKAAKKRKKEKHGSDRSFGIDFSKLPVIDNNGLNYLPVMQYFPVQIECPVKPANKLPPEQAVSVIIHLPNGGFKCVAIPLDALDEDPNDDYKLRIIREKAFLISQVLEEANVEPGASALGLDGFRKLLTEVKKPRDPNDSDDDDKPKPPPEAGFSKSKKKKRRDFETKSRVIRQILADDADDMSIEAQLARAEKIRAVAKQKKYTVPKHEAEFLQDLFLPPIHKWDPAYKSTVTSLPIPHNSWVDGPPELNEYMLPALRNANRSQGGSSEPQTRWDHLLVDWQRTSVHMASGLTPWLALELPDDPDEITPEMLADWKKKQKLARLAATGCNILYEELGLRRRMNFYFEFKKSSEWKNLGFLKTVRMGKEILKKDISKAFNEVKATSRAYDKQVALTTNRNFNAMQATKPWATPEDVSAFAKGRGGPNRGRGGFQNRNPGRPGNDFVPRNNSFQGGQQFSGQPRSNNPGRGNFNQPPKPQRGNPQQGQQRPNPGNHNNGPGYNNHGNNNNNYNNSGYPNKPKPPNKNFRGGGN